MSCGKLDPEALLEQEGCRFGNAEAEGGSLTRGREQS